MNEYNLNVMLKNSLLSAHYPARHLWGADSRDYVEALELRKQAFLLYTTILIISLATSIFAFTLLPRT
jgi:hypothetical protein